LSYATFRRESAQQKWRSAHAKAPDRKAELA
jgi:hypothetical protein